MADFMSAEKEYGQSQFVDIIALRRFLFLFKFTQLVQPLISILTNAFDQPEHASIIAKVRCVE